MSMRRKGTVQFTHVSCDPTHSHTSSDGCKVEKGNGCGSKLCLLSERSNSVTQPATRLEHTQTDELERRSLCIE